MRALEAVTTPGETAALCQSVGVSRASLYRRRRPALRPAPPRPRAPSPRAATDARRCSTCCTASGQRVARRSPCHVARTDLPLCSIACSRRPRSARAARPGPASNRPELVVMNQVWSWDITAQGPDPTAITRVRHPRPRSGATEQWVESRSLENGSTWRSACAAIRARSRASRTNINSCGPRHRPSSSSRCSSQDLDIDAQSFAAAQ